MGVAFVISIVIILLSIIVVNDNAFCAVDEK